MYEDVLMASGANSRLRIDQFDPALIQPGNHGCEVRHAQADVVESFPALSEEASDGGIRLGRLQKLDAAFPQCQQSYLRLFLRDGLVAGDREPEDSLVKVDRLGQRFNRHAQMIQHKGAGCALIFSMRDFLFRIRSTTE